MTIVIAYIPVLHKGYLDFLTSQSVDRLLLLSPETIPEAMTYIKKDLRAMTVAQIKIAVESLDIVGSVEVATIEALRQLGEPADQLTQPAPSPASVEPQPTFLLPNEDISEAIIEKYLSKAMQAGRVKLSPIFLRWDKKTATAEKIPGFEQEVTADEAAARLFGVAYEEAGKSTDWWRHVGAVASRDGRPLFATHNTHLPHEQQPYVDGDARALFSAGEWIELTSAIHAEAALIAHAARAGVSLDGCALYVTTFPCPPCAKLIAHSGIAKLYFAEGYAMFDGETIVKDAEVEIVKVAIDPMTTNLGDTRSTVVAYPSTSSRS